MIQGLLALAHEKKWMDLPVVHKLEANDSIRPYEDCGWGTCMGIGGVGSKTTW